MRLILPFLFFFSSGLGAQVLPRALPSGTPAPRGATTAAPTNRDTVHAREQQATIDTIFRSYRTYINRNATLKRLLTKLSVAETALVKAPVPTVAPVASVIVGPPTVTIPMGAFATVSWELRTAAGVDAYPPPRVVTWTTENAAVATWANPTAGDGRIRSAGVGVTKLWVTSEGKTAGVTVTVTAPLPPDTTPPIILPPITLDTGAVWKIAGPYLSSTDQKAMGGPFVEYDAQFARYDTLHWPSMITAWTPDAYNYYDRGVSYYVRGEQTKNPVYRFRGDSVTRDFRKRYIEANNYAIASWEGFVEGLAIHSLLTGDTASRKAVGKMGDYYQWFFNATAPDERIAAYTLRAFVVANQIKAPSVGIGAPMGLPPAGDWPTVARAAFNKIILRQRADGGWPGGPCGGMDHPFTAGLLMDAMIRYYENFEKDARVITSVKKTADYLWANDWLLASNAFKYIGGTCEGEGGPGPAPILNPLIVNGYAWLFKVTGDSTYRTRAIAMYKGAVDSGEAGNSNPKMFNQLFSSSYRGVYWLRK